MTRRHVLAGAAFGAAALALSGSSHRNRPPVPHPLPVAARRRDRYVRGLNCYTLNYASVDEAENEPQDSYRYLAARGHRIIRLPFQWGLVQPELGGPLDAQFAAGIVAEVAAIGRAGMRAIIDVHSGGRHPDVVEATGALGSGISQEQFNDLWLRLSDLFRGDRRVYAYDLMNEPYELPDEVWQSYSQGVVAALRAHGDGTLLWIEGNEYSSAGSWREHQPKPWIDDPIDRHAYSAHCYPGITSEEPQREPTAVDQDEFLLDLSHFVGWLAEFDRRGSIGEVGWPSARYVGATGAQEWNRLGEAWYAMADKARLDVTYFGASSAYDNWLWAYNASQNGLHLPGLHRAESQAVVIEAHPSSWCAPRCGAPPGEVRASPSPRGGP
jgi:endoglucanase